MLRALGKLLDGSTDKKIGVRLWRFRSSLLNEQQGHVTQLGALRKQADSVEMQIKKALAGSSATIGLPVGLRLAFDTAVGGADGSMDWAAFQRFVKAVHLEADEAQLKKWYEETGGSFDGQGADIGRVNFADIEAWLLSQRDPAFAAWLFDSSGMAKLLPKGSLELQLCKNRIKTALGGVTKYSQVGVCRTLGRVVTQPWVGAS